MIKIYKVKSFEELKKLMKQLHKERAHWTGGGNPISIKAMRVAWNCHGENLAICNKNGVLTFSNVAYYQGNKDTRDNFVN